MTEPEQPVVAVPLRAALRQAIVELPSLFGQERFDTGARHAVLNAIDDVLAALAVEAVRPETLDVTDSLRAAMLAVYDAAPDRPDIRAIASAALDAAAPHNLRALQEREVAVRPETDIDELRVAISERAGAFQGALQRGSQTGINGDQVVTLRAARSAVAGLDEFVQSRLRATPLAERPE